MLTLVMVDLFNIVFCVAYVLLLLYVGPYLAIVQLFHIEDPIDKALLRAMEDRSNEHEEEA